MARTVHTLGRDDFKARIRRIERRTFVPPSARNTHRKRNILLGFGWAYAVLTLGGRAEQIKDSIKASAIPIELHSPFVALLASFAVVSMVMFAVHVLRLGSAAHKGRSGPLVSGATVAIGLVLTPPSVVDYGYGLLDDNTRTILEETSASVLSIDWGSLRETMASFE
ncbi:hypothetical protein [Mesobacterium pallidum]|uniref:hypothetical protein n=1 Tax=Mesobacterium pallidum TaxID=2872037 RepID=UPI001EE221DB|nr:hypothetical protein [Mesobacterium pallidum]